MLTYDTIQIVFKSLWIHFTAHAILQKYLKESYTIIYRREKMIHDDYFAYTTKYKALYGDQTLVLMEVGSFFEAYSVTDAESDTYVGADTNTVCGLLHIQSTRKSKSVPESRTNPVMFGFPTPALHKFLAILMQQNYTVVLVEQVTPPPNPHRAVTQVISPSTYTSSNESTSDNRYLMCIYFGLGYDRHKRAPYMCVVASFADVTTGESFVLEDEAHGDHVRVTQDADRLINMYRPHEVLVCCDPDIEEATKHQLRTWIQSLRSTCVHDQTTMNASTAAPFQTQAYQCSILRKAFPDTGLLTPIEHVDLATKWYALISYVHLINFLYQHNETLVQRMRRPTIIAPQTRMLLANNAITNLNILPSTATNSHAHGSKCNSIFQLLNICITAMGRRMFRNYLTSPLTNKSAIEARYVQIDAFLEKNIYTAFIPLLRRVQDIERLYRRLQLRQLQPTEMASLLKSLSAVNDTYNAVKDLVVFNDWNASDALQLTTWISNAYAKWDIDSMTAGEENFYIVGKNLAIDNLASAVTVQRAHFKMIVYNANRLIGPDASDFKLDTTADRDDFIITITKRRYEAYLLLSKQVKVPLTSFEERPVSASNKTMFRLTYPDQVTRQSQLHNTVAELKSAVREAYLQDLVVCDNEYAVLIERAVAFIGQLDVIVACAKNAVIHHYVRPTILDNATTTANDNNSCIRAHGIRHPLIEVLQTQVQYVPNDISIGIATDTATATTTTTTNDRCGMLVFGINASGKSSLMKALGINLIMAQAGMYVASDDFAYVPYDHIFTRIPGGDNLFRAQSTFVAEMSELRTILQYATNRSLIIGDELASGSESVSAISIVAAGIVTLAKRKACFIFATHLHEVAQLDVIKDLHESVQIFHMRVSYDSVRDLLIYDRKLQPGVGDTLYGLEVCKSLDLPSDFLLLANTIRQTHLKMSSTVVSQKQSRYSSQVFVDVCAACQKPAQEVHHIKEQMLANAEGFIGNFHKNSPHNLMAVCSSCHDAIHAKSIIITGYSSTSAGVKLLTTTTSASVQTKIGIPIIPSEIPEIPVTGTYMNVHSLRNSGQSIASIANTLQLSVYKVKKILRG